MLPTWGSRRDDHGGMKDFREHLRLVRRAPEMSMPVPGQLTFDRIATYLEGMNAGSQGDLLDGFREYLILRLNVADNRSWPTLLRRLRLGENADRVAVRDPGRRPGRVHLRRPG